MSKRKIEVEYINWKIKKLKKKLKKRSRRDQSPAASIGTSSEEDDQDQVGVLLDSPRTTQLEEFLPPSACDKPIEEVTQPSSSEDLPQQMAVLEKVLEVSNDEELAEPSAENVDPEVLDILGSDPSAVVNYGADIHKELATRLQHIATRGLSKDTRKELTERYLIPGNCVLIGAPLLNAEIKAAVTETVGKRDKGIEGRQSQLATAISGLARVLTEELKEKTKNKERLKQLMDVCRILCNIQHAESTTRRNFAIFSINKDLKDHLTDTKIDRYLFGENLSDTIRAAKAVNKSGTEMKSRAKPKTFPPASNLNWRSPAPARKQQGVQRGREAAPPPVPGPSTPGPSARYNRNTKPGNSSKASRHPSKFNRRR